MSAAIRETVTVSACPAWYTGYLPGDPLVHGRQIGPGVGVFEVAALGYHIEGGRSSNSGRN